jgi:2-phospho-L-lactate transferase/gluconeogenesis factor (CofD/UPF0052 family)
MVGVDRGDGGADIERKKVVVIGGGTGTYTALMGLKRHDADLTAIVSMADNGGSSGVLRDEFGHLPAGDVRRCLLALSADLAAGTLRRLSEYRREGSMPVEPDLEGRRRLGPRVTAAPLAASETLWRIALRRWRRSSSGWHADHQRLG